MRSRITQQWLAGTLGGFIGWCLTEPCPWITADREPGQAVVPVTWSRLIVFGIVVGMSIGAAIAAAYGSGSSGRRNRYMGLGLLYGAIGGGIGLALGQTIYQPLTGMAEALTHNSVFGPFGYLLEIFARSLGWAGIGFGLGVLQGGINGSTQRSRNGAIGGVLGGFVGGCVFALMSATVESTTADGRSPFFFLTGAMMRGTALTLTGSAIGLLVGLTERFLRNAWVRVKVGRNEGQEFLIEKSPSTIGRDELSDIPLFGDMQIARQHASIIGKRGAFMLQAAAPGVYLNNVAVQSAPLSDGDAIRISTREIEFHQKGAPRAIGLKDVAKPAIAPKPLAPEGICEFCGQRKDALGGCACSPASPAPPLPGHAPSPARVFQLRALRGPYVGRSFPLEKPEVTLGRGDDRDIRLPDDTSVSRRHARFVAGPTGMEMLDEGSSNGTWINGARITRSPLKPGDEVRLGNSVFRVEAA
ncbi:MAG TPA: FHA domain-containing protein [Armatimonadota bacterium]|jgi:pSer/pThr/pTyr-binding forkhead associated (FHA) protein